MYGRYYRKKRFSKTKKGTKRYYKRNYKSGLQKQIKWIKKNMPKKQLQYTNFGIIGRNITDTPYVVELTGFNDGRNLVKSIYYKYNMTVDNTVTEKAWFRMVLVMDTKPNEGIPATWGEVYETVVSATGINAITAMRKLDFTDNNGQRFKVLKDTKFSLINDASGTVNSTKIGSYFKKCRIPIIVDGAETPQNNQNTLYLMILGTTTGTQAELNMRVRCRYTDRD